jgi:hypothetical protein
VASNSTGGEAAGMVPVEMANLRADLLVNLADILLVS